MAAPRKLRCTVAEIVSHGEGVYSVALRPDSPAPRFLAGQFLHLALDAYDPTRFWPDSRVFSIASSPEDRSTLRITYSTQGAFTRRMESELREGCSVWIKMPYGHFVVPAEGEIALFAGGTGITAFAAFVQQRKPSDECRVILAYGARSDTLLVYRQLMDEIAARFRGLTPLYFTERRSDNDTVIGRVSIEPVWKRLERPFDARYFIAGPPLMIDSVRRDLLARQVKSESIYVDAWE